MCRCRADPRPCRAKGTSSRETQLPSWSQHSGRIPDSSPPPSLFPGSGKLTLTLTERGDQNGCQASPPSGKKSGKSPLGVMGGGASPSPHTVLTIPPDSGIHPLLFSRLWGPLEGMSRISHLPAGAVGLCVQGSWTSHHPKGGTSTVLYRGGAGRSHRGFLRLKGRRGPSPGRVPRGDGWRDPGPLGGGDLCSVDTQ